MALAFVCSISGFIYQFVIATFLATETGYVVEAHALTLAFFMAALGLGSANTQKTADTDLRPQFITTEFAIIIIASLSYFALSGLTIAVAAHVISRFQMLLAGQILVLVFGFFVGRELPLILRLKQNSNSESAIVALNYFGALGAALLTTTSFFAALPPGIAFVFVSLFAIAALFLAGAGLKPKLVSSALVIIAIFATVQIELPLARLYYFYTTSNLAANSLSEAIAKSKENIEVWTSRSVYQRLDVVTANVVLASEEQSLADAPLRREWQFWLYLDHAKQITSVHQEIYHELMGFVPINLTQTEPRRILILGGGDGILAKTLLQKSYVESIEIVEIDQMVLDLSSNVQFITRLNENSLRHPKVQVITEDAFTYLYRQRRIKKYDAVYLDFPFPRSDDHLRLYSVEMYKMVLDCLNETGFFAFDFPFRKNSESNTGILSTMREAGAKQIFAYGRTAAFLMARKSDLPLNFELATSGLSERPLSYYENLSAYLKSESETQGKPFNSILRPLWTMRRR